LALWYMQDGLTGVYIVIREMIIISPKN
jgi:hypothetical protein